MGLRRRHAVLEKKIKSKIVDSRITSDKSLLQCLLRDVDVTKNLKVVGIVIQKFSMLPDIPAK